MTPAVTPTLEKKLVIPRGPSGPGRGDGDRPGGDGGEPRAAPVQSARIGVWLLAGTITILFGAFTSTYLARRGGPDWQVGPMPAVLWLSTAVLLASSAAMEWARAGGRRGSADVLRNGLLGTTSLGLAFLVCQVFAWRQLATAGVYLSSNPHSSFFFLLTGAHALHLAGGILALFYALWKVRAAGLALADPVATYWHFMGGLWLYLFVLLFWL